MRARNRNEEKSDIDISPLIDMVFILLIFFMVTTTFEKDQKIELERPSAQSASMASGKSIKVHIDRSGEIYMDGEAVRSWMLQSHIRDALRFSTSSDVLVVTDQDVAAKLLIEVIDQCRLAGAKDVGVATRYEAG